MAGGGTEQGRMEYGAHYLETGETGEVRPVKLPAAGFGRGTFNHKFLLCMNGYVSKSRRGRIMLWEFLQLQREHGHCSNGKQIETLSASHGQLNEAAAAVALVAAVRRGDQGMERELRWWWWCELALARECEVPGQVERTTYEDKQPLVWAPGWRALKQGAVVAWNACRDLCYAGVRARAEPGSPYTNWLPGLGRDLWRNKYNLAAFALARYLPASKAAELWPAEGFVPTLPRGFHSRCKQQRQFLPEFTAWWDVADEELGPDLAQGVGWYGEEGWIVRDRRMGPEDGAVGVGVDWSSVKGKEGVQ